MATIVTTSDGSCCCGAPPTTCIPCAHAQALTCVRLTVAGCACLSGTWDVPYQTTYSTGGLPAHTIRRWARTSGYDIINPCGSAGEMVWVVEYNQNTGCFFQHYAGVCGAGSGSNLESQTPGIFGLMWNCDPLNVRWTWPYNAGNPLADNITCPGCGETVTTTVTECVAGEDAPAPSGQAVARRRTPLEIYACRHRGEETGVLVICKTCSGNIKLKTFGCAVHGVCTIDRQADGVMMCSTCPDRSPPEGS